MSCRSYGKTSKVALVCYIAGGKTIGDTLRADTISSFATQICFQKLKRIKINMDCLKRVKQMPLNLAIKLCNIIYDFDH